MSILSTRRMLLHTKGNYTFYITTHFNQTDEPSEDPKCPRVNSWASPHPDGVPETLSPYITATTSQTDTYSWYNEAVGVDVFYWNGIDPAKPDQEIQVEAQGYASRTEGPDIDSPDQNKLQLIYTRPGTYYIDVTIYDKPAVCGGALTESGASRPLNNPWTYNIALGSEVGVVRVKGMFKGAPDRVVLHQSGVEVLDSLYRGASGPTYAPQQYATEIYDAYIAAGYSPEIAAVESIIIPCQTCGTSTSRYGDFDLFYEKDTAVSLLNVQVFSPIDTFWRLWVYCPVSSIQMPLFGYDFLPIRETLATSVSANCYYGVCATDMKTGPSTNVVVITNNDHHQSWASDSYVINQTMHDQHAVQGQYYEFAAYTVGTLTATISGALGPMLGRGAKPSDAQRNGPMSAALIYNTTNVWTTPADYTVIADFKVDCDEWTITDLVEFNATARFDATPIVNSALSANPITLVPSVTTYFRFVPYYSTLVTGTFRVYDSEIAYPVDGFKGGEDFAFYGNVTLT